MREMMRVGHTKRVEFLECGWCHELPSLGRSSYFPCLNKIGGLVSIQSVYTALYLEDKTCLVVAYRFSCICKVLMLMNEKTIITIVLQK